MKRLRPLLIVPAVMAPMHALAEENAVRDIVARADGAKTVITLRGSATPSFTAYRLEHPARLVVDLAGGRLERPDGPMNVDTWAVGQIAFVENRTSNTTTARVMIGLKRDASYDVKARGTDVVITIIPDELPPPQQVQPPAPDPTVAAAEAAKAKQAREAREAEEAQRSRAEASRKAEEQRRVEAEAARSRAEADTKTAQSARDQALSELKKLEAARAELAAQIERARTERGELEAARAREQAALDAARTALKERERKSAAAQSEKDAAAAKHAADEQAAQAAEVRRLEALRVEADKLAHARDAELKQLEAARAEADKLARAREAESKQVGSERARAADQLAREREAELAKLESIRAEAQKLAASREEEQKRLEAMRAEELRLAEERKQLEALRAETERAAARLSQDRDAEQRRLDALRAEAARSEQLAKERKAQEAAEAQRLARLKAEADEAERVADARKATEAAEAEKAARLATERKAHEATESERLLRLQAEAEKSERAATERKAREAADAERLAQLKAAEAERLVQLKAETEKAAKLAAAEQERASLAQSEREKLRGEAERLARERADEAARFEAQRKEADRVAAEQATLQKQRAEDIRKLEATRAELERATMAQRAELVRLQKEHAQGAEADAERARAAEKLSSSRAELARLDRQLASARGGAEEPIRATPPAPIERREGVTLGARTDGGSGGTTLRGQAAVAYHARITGIDFRDEEQVDRVVISLAGDPEYTVLRNPGGEGSTAELRIRATELPPRFARTLDTTAFGGPVAAVSTYPDPEDPGAVRVAVKLAAAVPAEVRKERGRIVWNFPKATVTDFRPTATELAPRATVSGTYRPQAVAGWGLTNVPLQFGPPPSYGGRGTTVGERKSRWSGQRIDLDFKDADIHNILRLLADVGNVNIVTSDDVKGTVTIRMKDAPWDQALDVILKTKGLGQVRQDNLIRVAPMAVLEKEQEQEIARRKQIIEVQATVTRLEPLSYADGDKILPRVQDVLSPRGKVSVDARTNTLIITDIPGNIALAEDLIRNLDTQTPQVLIEARIVEARTTFLRDIGIQWGGSGIASSQTGNPTGLSFPNTFAAAGGNQDQITRADGLLNGQASSPNYVVNLPATTGTGLGGVLGMTFGSIAGNLNINLRLSAAETQGTLRILSAPKITTLDNVQASIEQGTAIPVSTVSAAGTNTVFIDANLKLTVKPHITNENSIVMDLIIQKNEPDFSHTSGRGDPTILKKEAKTQMLVRDGDTAVIGGIYSRNSGTNYSKIPWLGDIPVLGWFFKERKENDDRTELLIFVTPRLVNRGSSVAANK